MQKTASQFSEGIFNWPWNLLTSYVVRPRNYWKVDPPEYEGSELVIKLWQKLSKISKISRKLTAGYQKWPIILSRCHLGSKAHHFGPSICQSLPGIVSNSKLPPSRSFATAWCFFSPGSLLFLWPAMMLLGNFAGRIGLAALLCFDLGTCVRFFWWFLKFTPPED